MDVLQHDPFALLHRRVDDLLGLGEALRRANSDARQGLLEVRGKVLYAATRIEALRMAKNCVASFLHHFYFLPRASSYILTVIYKLLVN